MEEAPQDVSLVTQVTTLANTVQELVAVVRDLKQELASQSKELHESRGGKKKKEEPKVESQTSMSHILLGSREFSTPSHGSYR